MFVLPQVKLYCRDGEYYYKYPGNGKRKSKDDEDCNEHLVDKDMTFLVDGLVNPAFVDDHGESFTVCFSHISCFHDSLRYFYRPSYRFPLYATLTQSLS